MQSSSRGRFHPLQSSWIIAAIAAWLCACSQPMQYCQPDFVRSCTCASGTVGTQRCLADGSDFSTCSCSGTGTDGGTTHDSGTPYDSGTSHDSGGGGPTSCVYAASGQSCTTSGQLYCGSACCSPSYPYHCAATALCYANEADALAACGSETCDHCVPAAAPAHEVSCLDDTPPNAWSPNCTCQSVDSNTGPTTYSGQRCGESPPDPMLCCASSGYPSSGSCNCYERVTWTCTDIGTMQCDCDYLLINSGITNTGHCDSAPAADGVPWTCCVTSYGDCTCREGSFTCASGSRRVTDCSTASAAGDGYAPTSCPSGTTTVTSCSHGL